MVEIKKILTLEIFNFIVVKIELEIKKGIDNVICIS